MVVAQVGQVVGEVGEVVAGADLQVLAELTVDPDRRAAAALTGVGEFYDGRYTEAVIGYAYRPVRHDR